MSTRRQNMEHVDRYTSLVGHPVGAPWWVEQRKKALEDMGRAGFPTQRTEAWWGTSPRRLLAPPWTRTESAPIEAIALWSGLPTLVFVDGRYHAGASSVEGLPDGVRVRPLQSAMDEPFVQAHLGRGVSSTEGGFAALSMALHEDGVALEVDPGVEVGPPIVCMHLTSDGDAPRISGVRHLIVVGEGARVRVIEHWTGAGENLTVAATEAWVGVSGKLDWLKLQEEDTRAGHVHQVHVHLEGSAELDATSVSLGGKISRTEITVTLSDPGAKAKLAGLYLGRDDQHIDHHLHVAHAAPDCVSDECFRGVLDDKARGVFTGRVLVAKDAQRTDAAQSSASLLLSDEAVANARPQLVIYADDVKCSHGATVGKLDDEAMFYLQQRGLSTAEARRLLVEAFASEVLHALPEDKVRETLIVRVHAWLESRS